MFRDLSMPARKVNGRPCTDTTAEADRGCDHAPRRLSCLTVWRNIMDIAIASQSLKSSIAIPNIVRIPTSGEPANVGAPNPCSVASRSFRVWSVTPVARIGV